MYLLNITFMNVCSKSSRQTSSTFTGRRLEVCINPVCCPEQYIAGTAASRSEGKINLERGGGPRKLIVTLVHPQAPPPKPGPPPSCWCAVRLRCCCYGRHRCRGAATAQAALLTTAVTGQVTITSQLGKCTQYGR